MTQHEPIPTGALSGFHAIDVASPAEACQPWSDMLSHNPHTHRSLAGEAELKYTALEYKKLGSLHECAPRNRCGAIGRSQHPNAADLCLLVPPRCCEVKYQSLQRHGTLHEECLSSRAVQAVLVASDVMMVASITCLLLRPHTVHLKVVRRAPLSIGPLWCSLQLNDSRRNDLLKVNCYCSWAVEGKAMHRHLILSHEHNFCRR
mmetsp:Transcript_16007/g.37744  ORF Transcript_16007/g.37744 Transcript_16007/m.37744 type:complete len:204 (-) Transcript_16007:834-1445(-)